MNLRPETIPGDVHAFTGEVSRPRGPWRRTLLIFILVTAALCVGLALARQKLRDLIAEKVKSSPNAEEIRPTNTGRIFEQASIANVPATAEAPSTPLGLNDPIPAGRLAQNVPPNSATTLPSSVIPATNAVDAAPPEARGPLIVEPVGGAGANVANTGLAPFALTATGQTVDQAGGLTRALSTSSLAAAEATKLIPRSLLLARGAYIPCVLESQLISNIAGFVSCIVTDNIYSDDGHALLIERGAHVSGEYRSGMHQGDTRLFVLWDRIKTPNGIVVDIASPGGDDVGGQGLPGEIDNHWWQRIGAAFLLSTFQDAVAIGIAKESASSSATTTVTTLPTNTTGAAQDSSKAVLDSTINIPPTLYKNRGELLTIYVARDLRFDHVYALQ